MVPWGTWLKRYSSSWYCLVIFHMSKIASEYKTREKSMLGLLK